MVKFDLGFGKSIGNKWGRLNLDLSFLFFWKILKILFPETNYVFLTSRSVQRQEGAQYIKKVVKQQASGC